MQLLEFPWFISNDDIQLTINVHRLFWYINNSTYIAKLSQAQAKARLLKRTLNQPPQDITNILD